MGLVLVVEVGLALGAGGVLVAALLPGTRRWMDAGRVPPYN